MNRIKIIIIYTLYYIGDDLSKTFKYDLGVYLFFKLHNWCMLKSVALQDKWGFEEPWIKTNTEENE